eukprot:s4536_g6.t1
MVNLHWLPLPFCDGHQTHVIFLEGICRLHTQVHPHAGRTSLGCGAQSSRGLREPLCPFQCPYIRHLQPSLRLKNCCAKIVKVALRCFQHVADQAIINVFLVVQIGDLWREAKDTICTDACQARQEIALRESPVFCVFVHPPSGWSAPPPGPKSPCANSAPIAPAAPQPSHSPIAPATPHSPQPPRSPAAVPQRPILIAEPDPRTFTRLAVTTRSPDNSQDATTAWILLTAHNLAGKLQTQRVA